jgi:hypothetical protein
MKLIQKKIENTLDHIDIGNNFMNGAPMVQQLRERQMGLHETKKLLDSKCNSQNTEEVAYKMGENLCQLFI